MENMIQIKMDDTLYSARLALEKGKLAASLLDESLSHAEGVSELLPALAHRYHLHVLLLIDTLVEMEQWLTSAQALLEEGVE